MLNHWINFNLKEKLLNKVNKLKKIYEIQEHDMVENQT
jgi:hypothetical protein